MARKEVNRTLFNDKMPTDNVTFGGQTYRIDADKVDDPAITEHTVRLAPTDRGGKLTGIFRTYDLV